MEHFFFNQNLSHKTFAIINRSLYRSRIPTIRDRHQSHSSEWGHDYKSPNN